MSCVAGQKTDVAPFARRKSWETPGGAGLRDTGLQWAEVRDIERIVVVWKDEQPDEDEVSLQYWRSEWPRRRAPKGQSGHEGWFHEGDWFNGEWQTADVRLEKDGRRWSYTFAPVNAVEFPDVDDFDATWRTTLMLRVLSADELPDVETLEAYSDSTWRTVDVAVEWGADDDAIWDGYLEVHNGHAEGVTALDGGSAAVKENGWTSRIKKGETDGITFTVWYMTNTDTTTTDRTIVTLRTQKHSFSFLVDDIFENTLYIKDFNVLISPAENRVSLADHAAAVEAAGKKTYYDRIFDEEEQTLSRARKELPLQTPFHMPIGLEGRRQRFGVEPDGSIIRSDSRDWLRRVPGRDTQRIKDDIGDLSWSFGLPDMPYTSRTPLRGYLPVMLTAWETGGVKYEECAFTHPLDYRPFILDINHDDNRPDDTVVAIVKFTLSNVSSEQKTARLTLSTILDGREQLALTDGNLVRNDRGVLRTVLSGVTAEETTERGGRIVIALDLKPGECREVIARLPYYDLDAAETDRLRSIDADAALTHTVDYWEERIGASTEITTPEPLLNDYYRAHVTHLLINHERHVNAPVDIARVGSFRYGAYANESVMQVCDLDRRGFHKEAERGYETWLRYQGTAGLNGDFTTNEGVFYGAGGFEWGNYNQNHGWVLWGLADHYFVSGDRAWLERVAGQIVTGCDWIINQRNRTMNTDETGKRVIEYGFLPAGVLEDIQDFWYWLATDAHTWWGMDRAAKALTDIGHPDAARITEDAENFRRDLLAGFEESMIRTPVVRLKDGTAVPHVPAHLHLRGRSFGWIRETLEGAIHLIHTGLIPADSQLATWILKDYEDNLYISEHYGYSGISVPDEEKYWFSRGGFSQQPNLLCGPLPYLYRDEIKHFVRTYFNSFAAGFHADTRMMTEHPLPELGDWFGDHFKTSDEAQNTYWLRLMFVYEKGDGLALGYGIPRYWLADGNVIGIRNACTPFGRVSLEITSDALSGRISADVTLEPREEVPPLSLRFRHPDGLPIQSVTVDGTAWDQFDGISGTIKLPERHEMSVVAHYAP